MTKVQRRRLYYVLLLLLGSAAIVTLVLFALQQNINLFYTPQELASVSLPPTTRIRVGGMVREGSLDHGKDLDYSFVITDYSDDLVIKYSGVLPDLFREGQGVVALGVLDPATRIFVAEQILAKHDEKYMPPELVGKISEVSVVS